MTGWGIVAIIFSVLGVVTPTLGIGFSALSGLLLIWGIKYKDQLCLASCILNLLNLTILSPMTFLAIFSKNESIFLPPKHELQLVYFSIIFIQFVGLFLWRRAHKPSVCSVENQRSKARIEPKL
ncbi:hypothetical protein CRN41_12475 [Vibrio vulnificus]|nr:hypothetical protein CRN41_12475 [Vibrio vulnificus]